MHKKQDNSNINPLENTVEKFKVEIISHLYRRANLIQKPRTIFGFVYKQICKSLYSLILKVSDPVASIKVGKKNIYINASSDIPVIQSKYRYYDTALPRICKFINAQKGSIILIDVGANVGDTVSLITDEIFGKFLCVEAFDKYFQLLLMNTENIQNVVCEKVLLSDEEEIVNVSLVQDAGTAYVSGQGTGDVNTQYLATTIDKLVEKHQDFSRTNILKVDTDGYDYKIIRGSKKLISESKPAIYFELSPHHLINLGENPTSIFEYLLELGYSNALIYDGFGYPFLKIHISDLATIEQIVNYARIIKRYFYYDVLVVHENDRDIFELFYQEEINHFPKVKW